jgi:hypothetical protein
LKSEDRAYHRVDLRGGEEAEGDAGSGDLDFSQYCGFRFIYIQLFLCDRSGVGVNHHGR